MTEKEGGTRSQEGPGAETKEKTRDGSKGNEADRHVTWRERTMGRPGDLKRPLRNAASKERGVQGRDLLEADIPSDGQGPPHGGTRKKQHAEAIPPGGEQIKSGVLARLLGPTDT